MTTVQTFGQPDLFITFTCNPNWQEIQETLHPGEEAREHNDLLSWVFKIKLKELLKDINEKTFLVFLLATFMLLNSNSEACHMHIFLQSFKAAGQ